MKIKSAAIIGVGAVGAVVASQLNKFLGKENVQCLADGERKARYERDGIFLNGERLDFNFVESQNAKPADLVIIATKNLQLQEAMRMMKNACGKNTIILSLLNGIQSERDIAAVYGEENLLYSFIISILSIHEKNKIECTNFGTIVFGEKDNSKSERVRAVSELFENAGVNFLNPDDIHLEMWKKFLINVTINTISALTRSTYGGFKYDSLKEITRMAGKEVVAVANAEGIALNEKMIEYNLALWATYDPHGKTSMLQDMEANRKSENDWFCGTVCALGKKHGIATPTCYLLQKLVQGSEDARVV